MTLVSSAQLPVQSVNNTGTSTNVKESREMHREDPSKPFDGRRATGWILFCFLEFTGLPFFRPNSMNFGFDEILQFFGG